MVEIVRGTTQKPISSEQLATFFEKEANYDGILYTGYPIIGTPEGPFPIDAFWVSPSKGIVIFNLIEGRELATDYQEIQDDSANKLDSKLRSYKSLMAGRTSRVTINVITFAPAVHHLPNDSEHQVCNETTLGPALEAIAAHDKEVYGQLVSVIQSISTIRKGRKKRIVTNEKSRGARLKHLEDSIANLDNLQSRAVIASVDDVQRIRGLAGSGKTIVLALKAAYLHAQHPDWKIAVTFNTRSLKGQFKQLINTFVIEQTNDEPDWDNLHIINAWGAPGDIERRGMYYYFCQTHGLEYYDLSGAQNKFGRGQELADVCQEALAGYQENKKLYDVILVDEAQDFPVTFLRLCYEMLGEKKRLVYAYDELQSLNSQSLPSPEDIFGKKPDGTPRVKIQSEQQDIILEKCYRNSRPVLATAHALGFGIYRIPDSRTGTGLIQIFDQRQLWLDVGYSVVGGELEDGKWTELARTKKSSPELLEKDWPIDDLVNFRCFDSALEQAQWVAEEIKRNIDNEELLPSDIVVINPDPISTKKVIGPIRKYLFDNGVNSQLAGVDTSPDVFFDSSGDSVVFSGVFRAKGNEAGMVYIINAQDCYSSFGDLATVRNRLFTAITRSKAWVRVLGIGDGMKALTEEFEQLRSKNFELHFTYPTPEVRKQLNIVNRDMSEEERRRVRKNKSELESILDDLEAGRTYFEDLEETQVKRLEALLNRRKKSANA